VQDIRSILIIKHDAISGVLLKFELCSSSIYSVSQKNTPPLKFSDIFSQTVGNF